MKRPIFFAAAILVFILSACSLAEDITPPPDYQAPTQNTVATVYPIVPPDLVRGAAIYSEKCAPCHGDLGRGNGSMASNLSVDVPAIGTSEVGLSAIPVDWFDLVTNGRMERSMPPFKSLDDRDRWDVVAYALSLHTTQAQLDSAKTIFEQQCQSCHGPQGKGDGEQTAGKSMPDWSQPERLAKLSEEKLFQSITTGIGDMPAYRETLSDEQRLALAAYVRSLTFASPGTLAASISTPTAVPTAASTAAAGTESTLAATGEASSGAASVDGTATADATVSQPQKTTITGKITSASGPLPGGLEATLRAFDGMVAADSQKVPVAADGSYSFPDVELVDNRVFMVTVTVDGVDYNSDPLHSSDVTPGQPAELPITIYEKSNDATLLRGDRLHVFFDFTDTQKVQVVELLIFSNAGQQVIAPAKEGDTLLSFKLPADATDLQFQDGTLGDGIYLQTADGFGVSTAYTPAEGYQILFAYNMPYDRKGNFEFYVPINVAEAIVMVPQDGVRMKSDQLTDAGSRPVQGINLRLFTTSNLTPDNPLKLSLSGRPANGTKVNSGSATTLLIGIGAFVLVGAGGAVYYLNRRRKKSEPEEIQEEETTETLMDAIITLDDQRRAGELSEDAYISRRSELKQRLERLTGQPQENKDAE